jgi:hypothetical protein
MERRRRREARRRLRAQTEGDLGVRLRGAALETRRRLRPVLAPLGALFGGIAPYVSGALLFVVKLFAALVALILELLQVVLTRAGRGLPSAERRRCCCMVSGPRSRRPRA